MTTPLSVADNYLPPFQKCIFGFVWISIPDIGPNITTILGVEYPGNRTGFITEL